MQLLELFVDENACSTPYNQFLVRPCLLGNFVDGKAGSNPLKRFSAGDVQLQESHDSQQAHNFLIDSNRLK